MPLSAQRSTFRTLTSASSRSPLHETFFPRHGFHLYDSDAIIVGTESGTATITDGADVARYEKMFAQLEAIASMGAAARPVLDRIASDYRDL